MFGEKTSGMLFSIFLFICFGHNLVDSQLLDEHPCDDEIYCHGDLLKTVQMARLYKDSKTFVDKPLNHSREIVLENFRKMMEASQDNPDRETVRKFVNENFLPEGSEFEDWNPSDWSKDIPLFKKIKDPSYRDFAIDLHSRWKDLGRKVKQSVSENQGKTSLIYMEKPFVVPGGRFREMYYWDSYWTILGLLLSQMNETVKGMLENFANLIETYGMIPNGNRIYYTRRSQPPLFIPMVDEYVKATNDKAFLEKNLKLLEREFNFWIVNRTTNVEIDGTSYLLAHYDVEVDGPRPESFYEDFTHAKKFPTDEEKTEFYRNMKSGAESGWDYSTKWFVTKTGEESKNLSDIQTRHIIPVELNAYLCRNADTLAKFFRLVNNNAKAEQYDKMKLQFQTSIEKVLWNSEAGAWFDYDLLRNRQRVVFFPSNVAPLWAECYSETRLKERSRRVINYIRNQKAFSYPGGIPTSMVKSGEQWDHSNAWAPLQEIVVTGLENTHDKEGSSLALKFADKWLKNNFAAYQQSKGKMFEKYDAEHVGLSGGGGEYDVVVGFGWTNGVVLHFLDKYGDKVTFNNESANAASDLHRHGTNGLLASMLAILSMIFGNKS